MDKVFTVYTYGGGEILNYVFNALAALINGNSGTLTTPLLRVGATFGIFFAAISAAFGNKQKFLLNWLMPFYLIYATLLIPSVSIIVKDPTSQFPGEKIDHVPAGIGLFASFASHFSHMIIEQMEIVFPIPGQNETVTYHKTGPFFASRLMAESRNFQITNSRLNQSFKSFVVQCVTPFALIGNEYTFDDLMTSRDIWGLIKKTPSKSRAFTYYPLNKSEHPHILSCVKGVDLLDKALNNEVETNLAHLQRKIFGKAQSNQINSSNQIKQYLPGAFQFMVNSSQTAQDIALQQMMIHGVIAANEERSTELGNAPNVAVRKAYLSQREQKKVIGGVASETLIALKTVLEALIYMSFIIVVPLIGFQAWNALATWFGLVIWINLWGPIAETLNFICNIAFKAMSSGHVQIADSATGISIANSVGFYNLHSDIIAESGYLTVSVGLLAYALVKGGSASIAHVMSGSMGVTAGAAQQAAQEMMSGNYQMGNISLANTQAYSTAMQQHNLSPSFSSGAFTTSNGRVSTIHTPDGTLINVASSQIESNLNWSHTLSESLQEQAGIAQSNAKSLSLAYNEAVTDSHRQTLDFAHHFGKAQSDGQSFASSENSSVQEAMTGLNQLTLKFAKDKNISEELAFDIFAKLATPDKFFLSAGVDGKLSNTHKELWTEAQDYIKNSNFQDHLSIAENAMRENRFQTSTEAAQRMMDGFNASYEKAQSLHESAQQSFQDSQTLSEIASVAETNSGAISTNLTQPFVESLIGKYGLEKAQSLLKGNNLALHGEMKSFLREYTAEHLGDIKDSYLNYKNSHGLNDLSANYGRDSGALRQDHAIGHGSIDAARSNVDDILGSNRSVSKTAMEDVNRKLSDITDQIEEQKEEMLSQGSTLTGNVQSMKILDKPIKAFKAVDNALKGQL